MKLDSHSEKPIFLQFAEEVENNILKGIFEEETQIPSTTEVAITLKINPATANRGVNLLVDEGIIYKKRGIGMFVSTGAKEKIMRKRRTEFFQKYVATLLEEAQGLSISKREIIEMIERGSEDEHD